MSDTPFADAQGVADAVLFEGYLLYPYRRSSVKNRMRFQFGVLMPRESVREETAPTVAGSAESWYQQTEALVEPGPHGGLLRVKVRFLQLQRRTVERPSTAGWQPVDRLEVGGVVHAPFDEAVERHADVVVRWDGTAEAATEVTAWAAAGCDIEELTGAATGRVLRRRQLLAASVTATLEPVPAPFRLARLRVRVENATLGPGAASGASRDDVLSRSLLATHTMVAAEGARFVSLLDPPEWAAAAAAACENHHTFPVLVGDARVLLSSPIILYDFPKLAPESPGDLFDSTEIDEILSLRTLTLTDEEKAEARATDPRAAALIERVGGMPPEVIARLHGVIRTMEHLGRPPPSRQDDVILGSGERAHPGHLVRLRPRGPGTDAADMFLAGRVARIESVFDDVDGRRHVAVTLPEDPGADLQQWYGRYLYFSPDELSLAGHAAAAAPGDGS